MATSPIEEIERQLLFLPHRKAKRPGAFLIEAVRNKYSPPKEFYASNQTYAASPGDTLDEAPLVLVDHLMPMLKDTELRVLLVLLRRMQFRRNAANRPSILSYQLLIAKTGRQSEAISKAITSLSKHGLIHINKRETQ